MDSEASQAVATGAPPWATVTTPASDSFFMIRKAYQYREVDIRFGPPVIYLESVAGCPFSCAMCKPSATKPTRVSMDILNRIAPSFSGLEILAIHGQGEPLMADLDYFVTQSVNHNFVLHMDTNGLLLTSKVADLLLQTRLSIRFSVHAGRPETYYKIMGVDFDQVKSNIANLVAKSKDRTHSQDFWFSFIIMKANIGEVEDFLCLAHDCGIRSVRFMHLWPNNDTLKGITVRGMTFKYSEQSSPQVRREFSEKMPRYQELARELGIRIEWGDAGNYDNSLSQNWGELANKVSRRLNGKWYFPLVPAKGLCAAPWLGQLTVTADGNVYLCCFSSIVLGNLYRSSLDDIWHGRKMTQIRQSFRQGNYPHECGYCRGFGIDNYPHNAFPGISRG